MGIFDKFHKKNKDQKASEQKQPSADRPKDDASVQKTESDILKEKLNLWIKIRLF